MERLLKFLNNKIKEKENNILSKVNNNENGYLDYDDFNNSISILLNLFIEDNEINYDLVNEYNEIKDTYIFNVKTIFSNDHYDVFMSISNKYDIYSNILRKTFNNKIDDDKYFNELTNLVKENNEKGSKEKLI